MFNVDITPEYVLIWKFDRVVINHCQSKRVWVSTVTTRPLRDKGAGSKMWAPAERYFLQAISGAPYLQRLFVLRNVDDKKMVIEKSAAKKAQAFRGSNWYDRTTRIAAGQNTLDMLDLERSRLACSSKNVRRFEMQQRQEDMFSVGVMLQLPCTLIPGHVSCWPDRHTMCQACQVFSLDFARRQPKFGKLNRPLY